MTFRPTDNDLLRLDVLGLTPETVQRQIDNFHNGFPKIVLDAAATIDNGGIKQLDDAQINHFEKVYRTQIKGKRLLKFVPASGAATRMFKDLYAFSSSYFGVAGNFAKEFPEVKSFLENIRTFAFFDDLRACMLKSDLDIEDYLQRGDYTTIINYLLKEQYLGYGFLPKALLKFHRYGALQRTALEEHIVEGAMYARCSNDNVNLHLTISPEHRKLFLSKLKEIRHYYESMLRVNLNISFSEQKHYTDIVAVNAQNEPLRDDNGDLIFRPGGHGALLENLNEQRADIIFIKNIDNVVPDWMKHSTIISKQVLTGVLLETKQQIDDIMRQLDKSASPQAIKKAESFLHQHLNIDVTKTDNDDRISQIRKYLNRPLRVCGMVKNQGEPGGGPFFTINTEGQRSLQIVEAAQINHKNPEQEAIFQRSTHFNPVDIVCCTKDYRGHYFDLRKYTDPNTGFISKKTQGAQTLKSQELPGLWNGAMAQWNTIFVEVPLATFNPVKSVNDLLRREHLEY
ncbi:MAG: DUF4301 family protein [Bacteroidales bacterium]|nr:DUF4301 family protein [Bacteroidales bacterium]